jgi:hypothetical protein
LRDKRAILRLNYLSQSASEISVVVKAQSRGNERVNLAITQTDCIASGGSALVAGVRAPTMKARSLSRFDLGCADVGNAAGVVLSTKP